MSFLLPLFEGIYLILTFCLFCISLVIGAGDLNDKVVENRAVKVKRNRCGSIIFNYLALFYFLVLLYILIVLLYVLIAVGFESEVYLIVIIIVPCTLILSLMLYDPSSICKYALCALPYAYYIPTYVNILQIYAICKTDDVSWGTRGNDYNSKHEAFKYKKFFYLIAYVLSNSIFGFLFER
jgi:cellulose synthase/poly-beta-1,6-N-acetylglucosamine synthase-like glycosyltransferase